MSHLPKSPECLQPCNKLLVLFTIYLIKIVPVHRVYAKVINHDTTDSKCVKLADPSKATGSIHPPRYLVVKGSGLEAFPRLRKRYSNQAPTIFTKIE